MQITRHLALPCRIGRSSTHRTLQEYQRLLSQNGEETEQAILEAHQNQGPCFLSLKSDPMLGRSITSKP